MSKRKNGREQAIGTLSLQRTYVAFAVGDNWVSSIKAHVDILGPVYPYRWKHVFINTPRDRTPSAGMLQEAVLACWEGLRTADGDDGHGKVFVCLPAWACRTEQVKGRALIARDERDGSVSAVTREHVAALEHKLTAENPRKGYVVAECLPTYFEVGAGRRVVTPLHELTDTLAMKATLVYADRSVVEAIRGAFASIGVPVDAFLSPYSVAIDAVAAEEGTTSVLVEIDRLKTTCSFVRDETLTDTAEIGGGALGILEGTAENLLLDRRELAAWLNEWELAARVARWEPDSPQGCFPELSLPGPGSPEELDAASLAPATAIFEQVYEQIKRANGVAGARVSDVVIAGDDYLTLRAVKRAADQHAGFKVRLFKPDKVYIDKASVTPGYARLIGTLRHENRVTLRGEPYREELGRDMIDRVNDWVCRAARTLGKCALSWLATGAHRLGMWLVGGGERGIRGAVCAWSGVRKVIAALIERLKRRRWRYHEAPVTRRFGSHILTR